jgi:hypothetical protein
MKKKQNNIKKEMENTTHPFDFAQESPESDDESIIRK